MDPHLDADAWRLAFAAWGATGATIAGIVLVLAGMAARAWLRRRR